MNEEQAERIIKLLKDIENHLANIESNTFDIPSIMTNTDEASQYLMTIKDKLR